MVKKKLLSVALVAVTVCSMIFTGCGSSAENTGNDTGKTDSDAQAGNTAGDVADVADDVEKPEKITIMVDGTFQATLADGQEEWVNKWEELTGIEMEVIHRITMPTMMCWDRPLPADRRTGQMSLSLDLPIIPDMRERELSGI